MRIELLDKNCLPAYQQDGDGAMDCRARTDCEWVWENGIQVCYVPLGFKLDIPQEHVVKLYSRSGHGWKDNITLANSVGIIDSNFKHELQAKLIRVGITIGSPPSIEKYNRVCQMVLEESPRIYLKVVDIIEENDRTNGFGSSGVK